MDERQAEDQAEAQAEDQSEAQAEALEEFLTDFFRIKNQQALRCAPAISHTQAFVLRCLIRQERTRAVDLARDLGFTPGALTRVLDDLEGGRLITRERSSDDRRVVWIRLTDTGAAVYNEVRAARKAGRTELLEYLGPEDAAALFRLASRIRDFVTEKGDPNAQGTQGTRGRF